METSRKLDAGLGGDEEEKKREEKKREKESKSNGRSKAMDGWRWLEIDLGARPLQLLQPGQSMQATDGLDWTLAPDSAAAPDPCSGNTANPCEGTYSLLDPLTGAIHSRRHRSYSKSRPTVRGRLGAAQHWTSTNLRSKPRHHPKPDRLQHS